MKFKFHRSTSITLLKMCNTKTKYNNNNNKICSLLKKKIINKPRMKYMNVMQKKILMKNILVTKDWKIMHKDHRYPKRDYRHVITQITWQRDSNLLLSRGLVKMLAFWWSVGIYSRATIFLSTRSLIKWYLISVCLVLECWTRFLEISIALELSQYTIIVSCVKP